MSVGFIARRLLVLTLWLSGMETFCRIPLLQEGVALLLMSLVICMALGMTFSKEHHLGAEDTVKAFCQILFWIGLLGGGFAVGGLALIALKKVGADLDKYPILFFATFPLIGLTMGLAAFIVGVDRQEEEEDSKTRSARLFPATSLRDVKTLAEADPYYESIIRCTANRLFGVDLDAPLEEHFDRLGVGRDSAREPQLLAECSLTCQVRRDGSFALLATAIGGIALIISALFGHRAFPFKYAESVFVHNLAFLFLLVGVYFFITGVGGMVQTPRLLLKDALRDWR